MKRAKPVQICGWLVPQKESRPLRALSRFQSFHSRIYTSVRKIFPGWGSNDKVIEEVNYHFSRWISYVASTGKHRRLIASNASHKTAQFWYPAINSLL